MYIALRRCPITGSQYFHSFKACLTYPPSTVSFAVAPHRRRTSSLSKVCAFHPTDPEYYHIQRAEGLPVGKKLKLWNLPPNCKKEELMEWFSGINVAVQTIDLTDDPQLTSQGVGGLVELATKVDCVKAIVRLDGARFRGHCIRMDFAERRPVRQGYYSRKPNRSASKPQSQLASAHAKKHYEITSKKSHDSEPSISSSDTTVASHILLSGNMNQPQASESFSMNTETTLRSSHHEANDDLESTKEKVLVYRTGPMYGSSQPPSLNRLLVGNLPSSVNNESLHELFSTYGTVLEANVLLDWENGTSRGLAVVAMSSTNEIKRAEQGLDGLQLEGQSLKVRAVV